LAKAVTEVAIGAAAIGAAFLIPGGGIAIDGTLLLSHAAAVGALASIAGSSIMSGIADALRANQGGLAVGVTTPIGPWGYIYGTQKVGGVEIFRESNNSQGTSNDKQLHRVYVLAAHPSLLGDWQLRIDGKQILVEPDGAGFASYSPTQTQQSITSISRSNGVVTMQLSGPITDQDGETLQVWNVSDNTFNGTWTVTQPNPDDATTFTYVCGGPDTTTSGGECQTTLPDYKNKIYIELLDGNHTSTFQGLLASGTTWGPNDLCLGRTLAYVRMGFDSTVFPSSIPNVSFVIQGKSNIFDPRTGTYGFTNNAALCIADYLSIPTIQGGFGMQIGTDIPTAQLIAAANICDEQVDLAGGGTISRYTCDTFFQLNTPRGTILKNLLSSCAGRISYQGGQYSIFPGSWVAPTLQLSDADLVGPIKWKPRFSIRDTCNAVKGTYISPENAYQQADVPMYAQDADHGYVADPWLAEDNAERIIREANFPCTDNSATAQRLEKIALLRTRYQGRGTLRCSLKAYQAVALDVIQFTHPRYTWVNKNFEVLSSRFSVDKSNGAPLPYVELDIAETDPSIFDWSVTEQLTPQGYKQPNNVGVRICNPPEGVSSYSGPGETVDGITYPSTITTGADGRVQNSIYVRWTTPNDANVVLGGHLEVQWQPVGASTWNALANVNPSASSTFINGVSDGAQYNIQVRAVNVANVPSQWVLTGPVTVSDVLSSLAYSGIPVAPPGILIGQGLSDGTAQITVLPFTATVGALSASCTPTPNTLTGLNQAQVYYVYYIDPTFLGGNITPIATQNPTDFENKTGYFLIGSITTPSYTPRYQPSTNHDVGSQSTDSPQAAYDNNVLTSAILGASWLTWTSEEDPPPLNVNTGGDCIWSGFPSITTSAATTLHCLLDAIDNSGGTTWQGTVTLKIGGTTSTVATISSAVSESDYTATIPSGTDLSTVSVEAIIWIDQGPGPETDGTASGYTQLEVYEIYIQ
jgi:hypothetical protein